MIDIIRSTMLRYNIFSLRKWVQSQTKKKSFHEMHKISLHISSINLWIFFHLVNKKSIVLCHPIHYCKYNTYALHKLCISYVMELWSKTAKNSWAKYSVIKTWLMIMYFLISFPLWDLGSGVAKFNHS